jgi:hypothetical protein
MVWHFFLPLESSCWSSGLAGRWIGRSVPSCQQGGAQAPPSSVRPQAGERTRRPCGLEGALGGLRPDSTRDGGDESTCWCSMGTSPRVVPAPLGWDSVLNTSEERGGCQLSWVRATCHPYGSGGPCEAAHQWYGRACRPQRPAQHAAAAPGILVRFIRSLPVNSRHVW